LVQKLHTDILVPTERSSWAEEHQNTSTPELLQEIISVLP